MMSPCHGLATGVEHGGLVEGLSIAPLPLYHSLRSVTYFHLHTPCPGTQILIQQPGAGLGLVTSSLDFSFFIL